MKIPRPNKRTYNNILHSKKLTREKTVCFFHQRAYIICIYSYELRDVYSTCKLKPNPPSGWGPGTCTQLEPHTQHLEKFFFSQQL